MIECHRALLLNRERRRSLYEEFAFLNRPRARVRSAESDRPQVLAGERSCPCAGSIARAPATCGTGIRIRC
jgi:hypothetical protein